MKEMGNKQKVSKMGIGVDRISLGKKTDFKLGCQLHISIEEI